MGLRAGGGEVGWERGGGWAGALGLQGDHCTGLRVRSQEGLPGLSGGRGNSDNQVWAGGMNWMHEAGRGVGRGAAQKKPPTPGPCRPLSGPATGRVMRLRELRLGKAKVETGASSRCQVPSCHMWAISHVGGGGEGSGGKGFISEASYRNTNNQMVLPDPGAK